MGWIGWSIMFATVIFILVFGLWSHWETKTKDSAAKQANPEPPMAPSMRDVVPPVRRVTVQLAVVTKHLEVYNWFTRKSGTLYLSLADGRKVEYARHAWVRIEEEAIQGGGVSGSR